MSADYVNDWNGATQATLARGLREAEIAVGLDPDEPMSHWGLAVASMWNKDLDRATAEAERTIALDPNSAMAYSILGNTLAKAGRAGGAVAHIEKAMRLDPQYPDIYLNFLGHARLLLGDYEGASRDLQRRIRRKPDTDSSRVMLASCHGHLGRVEDARAEWDAALEVNPGFSLDQRGTVLPYSDPADWRRILDGLAKAGLAE